MTKGEIATIQNIVARLKERNLGCSNCISHSTMIERANIANLEVASRVYLNTWIIPSLEMLLPGEGRDVELAESMSK